MNTLVVFCYIFKGITSRHDLHGMTFFLHTEPMQNLHALITKDIQNHFKTHLERGMRTNVDKRDVLDAALGGLMNAWEEQGYNINDLFHLLYDYTD